MSPLKCSKLLSDSVSLNRNWTRGPGSYRALQHARLHRVSVTGTVQWDRSTQVCTENSHTTPGNAGSRSVRQTTSSCLASILPRQTGGVQLWGVASYYPTNVCSNGSLASGQDRWGLSHRPSHTCKLDETPEVSRQMSWSRSDARYCTYCNVRHTLYVNVHTCTHLSV